MTGFVEPHPDVVTPNPGGPDDPLGESLLDPSQPWLRVFAPRDRRVVIGRAQDPWREVAVEACRADGVAIHRRVCGGGAVVLAPGMVVVAARLRPFALAADAYFARINAALAPALAPFSGSAPVTRGHGDLALIGADGVARKILGASLRQTSRLALYLGVVLVADAVPLMERWLRPPSREPAYRAGRGHAAFCTSLGGDPAGVVVAAAAALERELADIADG